MLFDVSVLCCDHYLTLLRNMFSMKNLLRFSIKDREFPLGAGI